MMFRIEVKKAQSAMEFVVLASFMLVVILGFFTITSSKVLEAKEEGNKKIAQDIAEVVSNEIELAKSVNDGYTRVFIMPSTVNGVDYSIKIVDNRELIVDYLGYEYVKFLPSEVTGNIDKGKNEISKANGVISLRHIIECSDGLDNDGDTNTDYPADAGCIDASDNDETNCPDTRCEGGETCSTCVEDCGDCLTINRFMMRNSLFNVISFADDGNAVLKGTLTQAVNPTNTANDEFIVKDRSGNNVAVLDLATGNMFIKGILWENQQSLSPSPSSNDFVVRSSTRDVISYIDESGNFYLKGKLTQNGNP